MLTGYCETTCTSVGSDMGNFSCMTETFIHRSQIDYWPLKKQQFVEQYNNNEKEERISYITNSSFSSWITINSNNSGNNCKL